MKVKSLAALGAVLTIVSVSAMAGFSADVPKTVTTVNGVVNSTVAGNNPTIEVNVYDTTGLCYGYTNNEPTTITSGGLPREDGYSSYCPTAITAMDVRVVKAEGSDKQYYTTAPIHIPVTYQASQPGFLILVKQATAPVVAADGTVTTPGTITYTAQSYVH